MPSCEADAEAKFYDLKDDEASALLAERSHLGCFEPATLPVALRRCVSEGDAETVQNVALGQLGVPLMALPSDACPWERVHVWLQAAEGLPARPHLWPFEPYVMASAEGCNTGSSADCPIAAYEFHVHRRDAQFMSITNPVWDERGLLCFRRGGASQLRILVQGSNKIWPGVYNALTLSPRLLLRHAIGAPLRWLCGTPPPPPVCALFDIPPAGGDWQVLSMPLPIGGVLRLRVRTSAWEERQIPAAALRLYEGSMTHEVLRLSEGNAAVLSYCCAESRAEAAAERRAVLWLPGRNDAFYHSHVAGVLEANGFDLFVLSYRRVGLCRRFGLLEQMKHNSHVASGSLEEYHEELHKAIAFIRARRTYKALLCYAHSTGAAILLDFLMEHGDSHFEGFIFNSPFLDWGWVGGPLTKLFIKLCPAVFSSLGIWNKETELTSGGTVSAWKLKAFSQFEWDPLARPLYEVPLTCGFAIAINRTQLALRRRSDSGQPITLKPFLVLASKNDDVLNGDATLAASHAIGPSRDLIELAYAAHDVFASSESETIAAALSFLDTWLKAHKFSNRSLGSPSHPVEREHNSSSASALPLEGPSRAA